MVGLVLGIGDEGGKEGNVNYGFKENGIGWIFCILRCKEIMKVIFVNLLSVYFMLGGVFYKY